MIDESVQLAVRDALPIAKSRVAERRFPDDFARLKATAETAVDHVIDHATDDQRERLPQRYALVTLALVELEKAQN